VLNNIRFYLFTDNLNETIIKNIYKFKNIAIIYKSNNPQTINKQKVKSIKEFCKKNKILFFVCDDIRLAIKYKTNGLFISSSNKKLYNYYSYKKDFCIIGSAHNVFEYYTKVKQRCETIMLSPIFYNKKYSPNKILGIVRFNLISNQWDKKICALGGINLRNLNKIKMTNASSIAFVSLINEIKIKKPIYHF
jgi:thiamine-phosphate pyrophosphorylase